MPALVVLDPVLEETRKLICGRLVWLCLSGSLMRTGEQKVYGDNVGGKL